MTGFSIGHKTVGTDVDLITISGSLDAHTFGQFEEAVNDVLSEGRFKIIVDLADVDYMSSAGAGVFIAARMEAEENDGKVVLLNPTSVVLDTFDVLGLIELFTVAGNLQEAVAAF